MVITPLPAHGRELNKAVEGYVRSPGLHLSEIYNSLYKELDPKRFGKDGPPDALAMEYGTAFEEPLEEALSRRLLGERPGEFAALRDGTMVPVGTPLSVIFTPDYFLFNGETILTEFKSTRMTIRGGIRQQKFDKWLCQIKAYAFPLQMAHTRLYAFFINGHGQWEAIDVEGFGMLEPGPLLLAWDFLFTERELQDNWQMLMRHATKKGMAI